MISFKNKKLLVIAPHPDDEVIGCGGLISKVKEAGGKVFVLYLTVATTKDFSSNGPSTKQERIKEIKKVAKFLRLDGWRIVFGKEALHLKLDQVPQREIINEIERGKKISLESVQPDIIAFPSFGDYNQDHRAAAEASFAACRPAVRALKHVPDLVLSYESPMNGYLHPTAAHRVNLVVELAKKHIQDKIKAMNLYKSQVRGPKHPRNGKTLEALAIVRGSLIGTEFGEGFYVHNLHV